MTYNSKLAAGNPQSTGRQLFGREQAEQLRLRNNFNRECNNLKKANDANAQFWSEQDEKAKR
ncbi:hypothetical protein [Serratia liquefaciens]|uniref:hypothetical protein n=1 Tax=Serratia liquefaciens TaxID=614 RepID=UPI00390697FF